MTGMDAGADTITIKNHVARPDAAGGVGAPERGTSPVGSLDDEDPVRAAWPLQALELRAGDLRLRPVRDVDAVAQGHIVHRLLPADQQYFMPRLVEGALAPTAAETARNVLRYTWRTRADVCPAHWSLPLAVLQRDRLVGMQSIDATGFAVTREVHTGSYLDPALQGRGIGAAMRAVVVEFAFRYLGATTASSGYMVGNHASRKVSERLGYADDGMVVWEFRGERFEERRMRLTAQRWPAFRPGWLNGLRVTGLAACWPLLVGDPHD